MKWKKKETNTEDNTQATKFNAIVSIKKKLAKIKSKIEISRTFPRLSTRTMIRKTIMLLIALS